MMTALTVDGVHFAADLDVFYVNSAIFFTIFLKF